jgi:hypothetical protein
MPVPVPHPLTGTRYSRRPFDVRLIAMHNSHQPDELPAVTWPTPAHDEERDTP